MKYVVRVSLKHRSDKTAQFPFIGRPETILQFCNANVSAKVRIVIVPGRSWSRMREKKKRPAKWRNYKTQGH